MSWPILRQGSCSLRVILVDRLLFNLFARRSRSFLVSDLRLHSFLRVLPDASDQLSISTAHLQLLFLVACSLLANVVCVSQLVASYTGLA